MHLYSLLFIYVAAEPEYDQVWFLQTVHNCAADLMMVLCCVCQMCVWCGRCACCSYRYVLNTA